MQNEPRLRWIFVVVALFGCGALAGRGGGCGEPKCPDGALLIPSGSFEMGTKSPKASDDERPPHRVTFTKPYCMDRTEVTRKAFRACEHTKVCYRGTDRLMADYDLNHPATFVSWDDAAAFCRWKGGRLPTEAEWEFAARGTDGRFYPWGNDPPTSEHWQLRPKGTVLTTADVGTHPKGRSAHGLDDMAGNVNEWVADPWGYYDDKPAVDPVAPAIAGEFPGHRTKRGSAWSVPLASKARATLRYPAPSYDRSDQTGFRCAYDSR